MEFPCTNCGASVPILVGDDFIRCNHCDAALFLDVSQTTLHFALPNNIHPADLPGTIQRKLALMHVSDDVVVVQADLCYFPYWRFATQKNHAIILPAAVPPVADAEKIDPPTGEIEKFDDALQARAQILDPEIMLAEATGKIALDRGDAAFGAALIHVPFYLVEYVHREIRYYLAVEAVSGAVLADDWPPSPELDRDRALGFPAVFAVTAFFLSAVLSPSWWILLLSYGVISLSGYHLAKNRLKESGW